jgi:glycosyltransferase involved in cell wall biosynthesis/SAM-dependent methyltransferase
MPSAWLDSTNTNTVTQVPPLATKFMTRTDWSQDGRWKPEWSAELVDALTEAARRNDPAAGPTEYPESAEQMYRALERVSVAGKDVCVLGSVSPWIEAIVLSRGAASVTTVDYCPIDVKSDKIVFHRVGDPELKNKQFDVVATFSSIEHDGLGRYGDPINPTGDISATEEAYDILRPGGALLFSVPVGSGCIEGNFHRIYNRKRLNRLFAIFGETVEAIEARGDAVPWPPARASVNWTGADWHNEPIFILRKAVPKPPPTLPQRLLVIGMEVPICDLSGASVRLVSFMLGLQKLGVSFDFVSFKAQKFCDRAEPRHYKLLSDIGIDVKWSSDVDALLQTNEYDAIVIQQFFWLQMSPMAYFLTSFMQFGKGVPLVVLSDDLHTMRKIRLKEPVNRAQVSEEFGTLAGADLVVAITDEDAQRIQEFAKLPSEKMFTLPYAVFDSPAAPSDDCAFKDRWGLVFLGAKTLLNMQSLQWFLSEVYPKVLQRVPGITLTIVGDLEDVGHAAAGVKYVGSLPDVSEVFGGSRVFVAPRTLGTGFATKNVLALQHGLPVVTSAEGFEGFSAVDESLPEDASPIVVAGSAQEFADKIIDLHGNPLQWFYRAANAKKYVRETLTVDAALPAVRALCERITSARAVSK